MGYEVDHGSGSATSPTSQLPDGASTSAGHIFSLIRARPGWTRQQLLAATGVSRTTLFERLDQLFKAGLVYDSGVATSSGGRPAQLLRFDDRDRVVLIFDLGQSHGRIAVADMAGRTLRMAYVRFDISDPPGEVLPSLLDQGDALLRSGPAAKLVGVGMGIPSPVDPRTGRLASSTAMPGWRDYGLLEHLQERWGAPVLIENDARALALGEASVRGEDEVLLAVKYSHGIGAGIVYGNDVMAGADGAAGDVGHIRITDGGPRCTCSRLGCLAAWASGRAMLRDLRTHGMSDLGDVERAVRAGDPFVVSTVGSAARRLGRVLAAIVATINPDTLVLGGSLGRLEFVAREVEKQIREDTAERSLHTLEVVASRTGEESGTIGLTRELVRSIFSPQAVDALVAGNA